nr:hypothetical protein BaRGS_003703 [Batillaria attramentaria]
MEADRLQEQEDGSRLPQKEQELTFEEAKTVVKEIQRRRWRQEHPDYNNNDGYYHLSQEEDQVIIVRLRTVHGRLKHHMFTKFNIGDTAACSCDAPRMTVLSPPAQLSNAPEPKSNNLAYRHTVVGEDLRLG